MNTQRHRRASGFTLVEILIVVIILGILAAIVIPQFTNASQDARKSSLTSQLQTLRSQLELYKLQHLDAIPPGLNVDGGGTAASADAWEQMIVKTDENHTVNTAGRFGPYLQGAPVNPLNGSADVFVTEDDVVLGDASGATTEGWVFNRINHKMWATAVDPAIVYDEANPANEVNTTPPAAD